MATASSELQLVVSAKDNASKTLHGITGSVGKLGSAMGTAAKWAGVAFAAAGTAAVAFGVSSVKAYMAAEKEMAKFNATLATMGKKGEEAKSKILEMADATTKLGFDDEDAANSMAKFFKITNDLTMAQKAQTTAMDIARAKSVDLETANRIVSLAFAGNTRALKEYGIELADGASKQQALTALNGIFAGQAQAYAGTAAGALDTLSVTYGNLKEDIGKVIFENANLGGLLQSLNTFILQHKDQIIALVSQGINVAVAKIREWYDAIGGKEGLLNGLQKAWEFIKILGTAIGILVTIIGWLVKAVLAAKNWLTEYFYQMFLGWDIVVKAFDETINSIKKWFNELVDTVKKSVESIMEFWDGLKEFMKNPIKGTIKIFKKDEDAEPNQFGGSVTAGRPTLVGEHRPEIFIPSQSGNIRQLDQASRGVTVNFNNVSVRNDADMEYIVDTVKRTLSRENELNRMGAY